MSLAGSPRRQLKGGMAPSDPYRLLCSARHRYRHLCSFLQSCCQCLRHFEQEEVRLRVAVILAAFVDDADVAKGSRFFIGLDLIELPDFEVCLVATVVDADCKLRPTRGPVRLRFHS